MFENSNQMTYDLKKIFTLKTSKEVTFQILLKRIEELPRPCQKMVYHGMIRYWNILTDLASLIVFDGNFIKTTINKFFEEDGIKSFVSFTSQHGVPEKYLTFIIRYTAYNRFLFQEKFNQFLTSPSYENYESLVDIGIEIANIRFWEVKGLDVSCECFLNKREHTNCPQKEDCETKNRITFYIFYEYFLLKDIDVFNIFLTTLLEFLVNPPEDLEFVIDLTFLEKRKAELKVFEKELCRRIKKFKIDLETYFKKPVYFKCGDFLKRLEVKCNGCL